MSTKYSTPVAILIAGTMISAAICFRPARSHDAGNDNVGNAVTEDAGDESRSADALIRAMHGDNLESIELEGWEPPPGGVYTQDDLRRLLDAWEKHWFGSSDQIPLPVYQHNGTL